MFTQISVKTKILKNLTEGKCPVWIIPIASIYLSLDMAKSLIVNVQYPSNQHWIQKLHL